MTQERYKPACTAVATPVEMKRRQEIRIPQVLTDYTLFYHYGDLDRTPVRNATFLATLSDGAVRQGALDGEGRAQLRGVAKGRSACSTSTTFLQTTVRRSWRPATRSVMPWPPSSRRPAST